MQTECVKCKAWDMAAKEKGYSWGMCEECFKKFYVLLPPEGGKKENDDELVQEVKPLYMNRSEVYGNIGRDTFEKIARGEKMAIKLTDSTLECKNPDFRCKDRLKQNKGLKRKELDT